MAGYTFISYAHENTGFVLKLARSLQSHHVSIWLDQWYVADDEEWDRPIVRAVRECNHFLVVLSPAAVNSWVVGEQVLWAREAGKPLISVLNQPCELPSVLQDSPCFDFTGRNYRNALEQLLRHYFPNQEIRVRYWPDVKPVWDRTREDLARTWQNSLFPLLWPGWLGPTILISLLFITSIFFWSLDSDENSSSGATLETLPIVQPTPTPPRRLAPIKTKVRPQDGKIMVLVPAGDFLMGSAESDPAANNDEKPQRLVYVDTFWIDKTEVTNEEYRQCVEAGDCTQTQARNKIFRQALLPVVGIDWEQAVTYCRWAGARLPTEAEWEKAARGPDGRLYPWGNQFDGERLNYCDTNCVADWRDRTANDGYKYTAPAGSYPAGASPYGVLDMSGNVWEWTADWYAPDAYANSREANPTGPASGLQRVIRGGSWYYKGPSLRVARRHKDVPTSSYDNIGFRCVVSGAEQAHGQIVNYQ